MFHSGCDGEIGATDVWSIYELRERWDTVGEESSGVAEGYCRTGADHDF